MSIQYVHKLIALCQKHPMEQSPGSLPGDKPMKHAELYTAGVRHALDWLGQLTARLEISSIFLKAPDAMLAQACLWRLPDTVCEVFVEVEGEAHPDLSQPGQWPFTLRQDSSSHPPLLMLLPFTLDRADLPFQGEYVLGCFHNALSYRRWLYPGESYRSLAWLRRKTRQEGYVLNRLIGIYPPAFLWRWALAMAFQQVAPAWSDLWRQRAFEHLSTSKPFPLECSVIVVFHAHRNFSSS